MQAKYTFECFKRCLYVSSYCVRQSGTAVANLIIADYYEFMSGKTSFISTGLGRSLPQLMYNHNICISSL